MKVETRGAKPTGRVGILSLDEVVKSLEQGERGLTLAKHARVTHQRISQVWKDHGNGISLREMRNQEHSKKRVMVQCCICGKRERVVQSRAKKYKTCSRKICTVELITRTQNDLAKKEGAHDKQDWCYRERQKGQIWYIIGKEAGCKGGRNAVNVQAIRSAKKAAKRNDWPWPIKI